MQQYDRGQHGGMQRQDSFAMQDNDEDEDCLQRSAKSESDEEDYESFFLQPASCPYNIKEKIIEANAQLVQQSMDENKPSRIQFRSDLVDFEPDLTDDDVQSIESYSEEVINVNTVNEELKYVLENKLCNIIEEEIIEESIFETIIELNHQQQCAEEAEANEDHIYTSPDDTDEIQEINAIQDADNLEEVEESNEPEEVEEDEEIEENLNVTETFEEIEDEINDIDEIIDECPAVPQENPTIGEIEQSNSSFTSESRSELLTSKQATQITKPKNLKKRRLPHEIDCKRHCIEELESRLELCINKLRLNEKISKPLCPTLRLNRQKCCAGGCKIEQKLPIYTGAHSEYGLSSTQINRLAKRRESTKIKEEKQRELSEAYRRRKLQQNEIIFRQWLKDISARQHVERLREKEIIRRTNMKIRGKHHYGYNSEGSTQRTTARIDSKEKQEKLEVEKQKQKQKRPKTANCVTNLQLGIEDGKATVTKKAMKLKTKNRPHTTSSSTARIYIEIPERLLDEGINLGELFLRQLDLNEIVKSKERLHMVTKVKSQKN